MKIFKKIISVFLISVILISVVGLGVNIGFKILYPLRYEEYITEYSDEYDLDKYLVMALIRAESNFIHDAHSGVARGLMQITDETALWISQKLCLQFETEDIEKPEINIKMGCYYLRYLLDYYHNDTSLALAAYNAGMGNVNKWLGNTEYSKDGVTLDNIPFLETQKYVNKVEKAISVYKKIYKGEEEKS